MNTLSGIVITVILVFVGVFLLGFKVFFTKKGEFPNIHIGGNKALRDQGVSCATSQDAEAQIKKTGKIDISKLINEIEEK